MSDVCVLIPTFRRPDGLRRAVDSLFAQTGIETFDILIADNDPDANALDTFQALRDAAPTHISLAYVHEPSPGVANARNTGLAATDAPLIAFLDDDQTAPPGWLKALLATHAAAPADVTFGPVLAVLPATVTQHAPYLRTFFSRLHDAPEGRTDASFGCGNALLNRALIPLDPPYFDKGTNDSGGEDDLLFNTIRAKGGTFAWSPHADVNEHVPASRAHLGYTLKRAFSYGQGPVTLARNTAPVRVDKILFWMAFGTLKGSVFLTLYLLKWLFRRPNRAACLDEAVRGFGKLFWWIRIDFYGAARLRETDRAARAGSGA